MSSPDMILETYESVAEGFARARNRSLFERRWLDRLINHAPPRLPARFMGCSRRRRPFRAPDRFRAPRESQKANTVVPRLSQVERYRLSGLE